MNQSPEGYRTESGKLLRWLAIAGVVLVALTGCGLKQNPPESDTTDESAKAATDTGSEEPPGQESTATDLTTLDPSTVTADVETNLSRATNAAQAWYEDAALSYTSVELPASLEPKTGNEVYVFGSPSDPANWWTYSVAQDSGKFVRAIIPKDDYLGSDTIPINLEYWKMNYLEALQLAESNGGRAFRLSNAGTRVTTFLSQRSPRGWLWWTVEYTAPAGDVFTLLVNPFRGEVVDETGTEIAPPTNPNADTGPTLN